MKRSTAELAARWWADQLRGTAKLDHGEYSKQGILTLGIAAICQEIEKEKQTPEQINAFESALIDVLMGCGDRVSFGVDYHPDRILSEAEQISGINLGMTTLPWKTMMIIDGGKVKVACGYEAPFAELN